MLYTDIRFLIYTGWCRRLAVGSLLLLESKQLLLLLNADLVALFQSKLGILAVDTLSIYHGPGLLHFSQHFQ